MKKIETNLNNLPINFYYILLVSLVPIIPHLKSRDTERNGFLYEICTNLLPLYFPIIGAYRH